MQLFFCFVQQLLFRITTLLERKIVMKRSIALLLVLVMVLATLAGCGSGNQATESAASTEAATAPASSTDAVPDETPAAEPAGKKHVENLVIGTTKQIEGLSIVDQSGSFGRINYNSVVYANFFYEDANKDIKGYFVTDYSISEDGRELTMKFPTDKIWHDGTPVTAEDVQFTFEYGRDVRASSALKTMTECRIDAEDQVTLVFSDPKAYYYVKNSTLTTMVLPKHIWEKVDDPANYTGEDAAIGCGPYKLTDVDKDAGILTFEAVPENNYLGEITVDKLTVKSYSDQTALLMAMANGEIDVMYEYANPVSYTLLDVISSNKDIDVGGSDYIGCNQATFGMHTPANQYHEFREALLKSLNWELLTYLTNGEYGQTPGAGILPVACAGYDASIPAFTQDVEGAAKLLDEAGFADVNGDGWRELPDGTEFAYKICAQYSKSKLELMSRYGEVMVDSLKAVGVNAYYDTESLASEEVNDKMCEDMDYDLFLGYTTSGVAMFRTCFWYFVPRAAVGGSGARKWGNTNNDPEVIAAYDQLQNATNNDEYLDAVKQLQSLAADKLFAFALCWEKCFFPYRTDKYEGFNNYDSVGVVHCETFFNLTEK